MALQAVKPVWRT